MTYITFLGLIRSVYGFQRKRCALSADVSADVYRISLNLTYLCKP